MQGPQTLIFAQSKIPLGFGWSEHIKKSLWIDFWSLGAEFPTIEVLLSSNFGKISYAQQSWVGPVLLEVVCRSKLLQNESKASLEPPRVAVWTAISWKHDFMNVVILVWTQKALESVRHEKSLIGVPKPVWRLQIVVLEPKGFPSGLRNSVVIDIGGLNPSRLNLWSARWTP